MLRATVCSLETSLLHGMHRHKLLSEERECKFALPLLQWARHGDALQVGNIGPEHADARTIKRQSNGLFECESAFFLSLEVCIYKTLKHLFLR